MFKNSYNKKASKALFTTQNTQRLYRNNVKAINTDRCETALSPFYISTWRFYFAAQPTLVRKSQQTKKMQTGVQAWRNVHVNDKVTSVCQQFFKYSFNLILKQRTL